MTVPPEVSADARRQELFKARLARAKAKAGRSAAQTVTRRPTDAPVRLSYAQRRLWFLTQYEPDSPAYNIPLAVRLRGDLDPAALSGAFEYVVARHEVLRTLYPTVAGEPAPLVEPPSAFAAMPSPSTVDGEDVAWWLAERARRPFDLATELPIRVALARVSSSLSSAPAGVEHVLSIVLHHVAADGWSLGVLADELAAAYAALRTGEQPRLPELPLQYADVAHWQAEQAGAVGSAGSADSSVGAAGSGGSAGSVGTAGDRALAWWVDALRGAPATVTVPTDRPRPPVAGDRGNRITVAVGPERSARVRALAADAGATPFVVLLAALQTVLCRYTGSEDVVVGSPIAGRTHSEMEKLVGCFVNTLALRGDLSGEPTVREFLARVRDTTFGAFSHQDVPFERLVDALDLDRDLSHTPLFQVLLNVHNQPLARFDLAGLDATFSDTSTHTAKFDVSVAVVDDPSDPTGDMAADLVWRTDLYDESTIRRLYGHLATVLDGMAAAPDAPLASVPLLTAAEMAWLAACDSAVAPAVAPAPAPASASASASVGTLHGLIERQAAATPDAVAVVGADATLTYAELDARADAVAARLVDAGVGPDRPVGLLAERGAALVVGMLGILKAGGAYLPLDPVYPDGRIRDLLATAGVAAAVVQPGLAGRLPADVPAVLLDGAVGGRVERAVPSDALCYVLFTSGSTGRPKAVAVEHRNYLNYLSGLRERTGAEPGWSWALVSTFAADLGTTNVFAALTGGGTLHLLSHDVATDVDAFAAYFRTHRVDAVKLVPSHLEVLLRSTPAAGAGAADAAGLVGAGGAIGVAGAAGSVGAVASCGHPADVLPRRLLICAGEPLRWDLVARVRAVAPDLVLHNHYGPTETTVSMLGTAVPAEPLPTATVPLGRPFAGVAARVLDARRRPVPAGVPGELYVGGAGVARGYLGRPDLTAERFVHVEGVRAYRTGDVVRRRTDGALEFLGRADNQVKVRGFRVEVGEVEAHLVALPEVREAVVVARGDGPARRLVAYLVLSGASDASMSAIRATLRGQLPDYMVPGAFVVLDALPLTRNGKVDRAALPDPSTVDGPVAADGRPPTTDSELLVAAVFAEVLEHPVTSVDDDFFALGGDSFSAVRTVRRIDPTLSVIEIFQRPTVRELAELLDARADGSAAGTGLLHRLTRGRAATDLTVVCVPYGGGSPITFQPLADALPERVALYAVGIPGHDTSRPDEPLAGIDDVADRAVAEIMATVTGPVLVYGHCLGGALATAVGARLEAAGGVSATIGVATGGPNATGGPSGATVGGGSGAASESTASLRGVALGGTFPAARLPGRFFGWLAKLLPADRMLSNRAYLDFLRAMGGFTDAYDEAERELLVRALRHDVRQAEHFYTEAYAPGAEVRITAPILCVVGEKDRATELYQERYTEWSHFADDVRLAVIPRAGHYFLKHQAAELAGVLASWATAPTAPTTPAPPIPTIPPIPTATRIRVAVPEPPKRPHGCERPGGDRPGEGRPSLRTFAAVAVGQFVSMIGTGLSAFALGVWVFQRTGSAVDFALIAMMAVLPAILMSPVAGAVADRYDRRRVMIVSDTLAAVGTVGLAILLWNGDLQLWHIYLFSSLGSLCNAFQRPAYLAAIAQLVPKRYLGQANGIAQSGAAAGDLLAALAGGVLVGLVGLHGVVIIDMATFLVGVSVLIVVRFPNLLFVRREEPLLREVVTGWRYIVRRRSLVAMVVFFVVFNYLFAVATVLVTPLVLARHSAAVLGVVSAVGGIGGVVGVLAMALWGGTDRRAVGMVGFTSVVGASAVVMGLGAHPAFAAAGLFGLWASLMILNSHWMALIQSKVGMELQGRVLATNQMLAMSMMPLGFLTAGPLADSVFEPLLRDGGALTGTVGAVIGTGQGRGIGLLLVCVGAALVAWGLLGLAYRPLRLMEDLLPDALPDAEIADKDTLQARADRALA